MTTTSTELHVIFGTGPLGRSVMKALLADGKKVRMINRSGRADVPSGVEVRAGDAFNPASTRDVTQGATAVYQCAQPEYHEWPQKFPGLQAGILAGVVANGAKFIVGENLYMYGDPNGKAITEDMPYAAHTRKGKVRQQLTEILMDAHAKGTVRVAMARGSDFFGPHDMVSGDQYFYPAIAGKKASGMGNMDLPHTFTYINDFGRTLATLGQRDDALGQAWHVPSDKPITQRELLSMIFEELGQPANVGVVTPIMLRLVAPFIKPAGEMIEMLYEFQKPFIMDSSKAQSKLGITPTPLRQAIQESVAWFRANPPKKH